MGLFDSIAAYLAPSAYADNQAEPQESSSKAYGEPNVSDDSEGRKGEPDEAKNVHTTTKSTDAGVDEDEKTDNEGEETVDGAVVESGDAEEAEEAEDEPEEEEEEEEDEPVDIMPKIEADCEKTPACRPAKHHYDECVERVQAKEEGTHHGPKEDCVEEFFHLTHCVTQCAAPKLFRQLK